jgi:hypothetical protein
MRDIDGQVHRLRKRRPLLDVMVAHQPERAPLGEHRRLVIHRSVAEVEVQARRHRVAARHLRQFPGCQHLSIPPAQRKKAVQCSFHVAHRNRLGCAWSACAGQRSDQTCTSCQQRRRSLHSVYDEQFAA